MLYECGSSLTLSPGVRTPCAFGRPGRPGQIQAEHAVPRCVAVLPNGFT